MNAHLSAVDAATTSPAATRTAVVVLGMHRSGTSAMARMLALLGCNTPKTLMPASEANARGFWESARVCAFNDEVLERAGSTWFDWMPINPGLSKSPIWHGLIEQGRSLIRDEFGDDPLIVLKDPRICRLSKLWLDILDAERIKAAFAIPLRNPLDVARSVRDRHDLEEHGILLVWLRHVLEAEAATRGETRSFSTYDQLLNDWERVAGRLAVDLDVSWPRVSPLSARQVSEFISPSLRNHVQDRDAMWSNPAISPWVADTFDILSRWAQDGEDPSDHSELDTIRAAFDAATPAFARPMLAATAARADREQALTGARDLALAEMEEQLRLGQALSTRLEEAETQLQAALANTAVLQAHADAAAVQSREDQQKIAQLESGLQVIEATEMRLRDVLADREALQASADEAADRGQRKIAQLERQLQQLSGESAALRSAADQARIQTSDAKQKLEQQLLENELLSRQAGERKSLKQAEARVRWLRQVCTIMVGLSPMGQLAPAVWLAERRMRRLKERQLFDAEAYLKAYPDVGAQGVNPLQHFVTHGIEEGRSSFSGDAFSI